VNVRCKVGKGETSGDRDVRDDSAVIAFEAVSCLSACLLDYLDRLP
jgi:hypothetical protein